MLEDDKAMCSKHVREMALSLEFSARWNYQSDVRNKKTLLGMHAGAQKAYYACLHHDAIAQKLLWQKKRGI